MILAHVRGPKPGQSGFFPGQLDGLGAMFPTRFPEQCRLALFAIQSLEKLVRALGLEPIGIPFVVGLFIESPLGSVSVKYWPAKSRAFQRIAIATSRHVPTREHKFKFASARLAKDRNCAVIKPSGRIMYYLIVNCLAIFRAMQSVEDLFYQINLVILHVTHCQLGDVPIIIDRRTQFMVERKTNRLLLFFIQALVQMRDQRLRSGDLLLFSKRLTSHWCDGRYGQTSADRP